MKPDDYINMVNTLVETFGKLPQFASETEVRANIEKILYTHGVGLDPVPAEAPKSAEFPNSQAVIDTCDHVIKAAARAGIEGNEMLTRKANVLNVSDRMSDMILSLRTNLSSREAELAQERSHCSTLSPVPAEEAPTPRRKTPAVDTWAADVVSAAQAQGWPHNDPSETIGYNAKYAAFWMADQLRTVNWGDSGLYDMYSALERVLRAAYTQAAVGKGAERHANARSFEQQPMQSISDLLGDNHGLLFQAVKKIQESTRMPHYRLRERELLGAINYIAGAIIFDRNHSIPEDNGDED